MVPAVLGAEEIFLELDVSAECADAPQSMEQLEHVGSWGIRHWEQKILGACVGTRGLPELVPRGMSQRPRSATSPATCAGRARAVPQSREEFAVRPRTMPTKASTVSVVPSSVHARATVDAGTSRSGRKAASLR